MKQPPRPGFFLVGSMKAGTSSLHAYLGTHPAVFMTQDPKEPTWFLEREQLLDVLPGVEKRGFWKSEENYLALFKDAGNAAVIGEASANYARLPRVKGVPERIARFNPAARIAFIMRDPVERTISHYWYMVRFFGERRDMLSAVREEADYVDTSHYAMQLRPYMDLFGAENVHVLTTEELRDHPRESVSSLFRWLGVDDTFVPPNLREKTNVAPEVITQVRGSGLLHRLRHSSVWNAVGPRVPPWVRAVGRRFSERPVERKEVDETPVRRFLRPRQREQTLELEAMLGRQFPEWKSLHADD